MKTVKLANQTSYGKKRYAPINETAKLLAALLQRDSKHEVTFTDHDVERIKALGFKVTVMAEVTL